MLETETVDRILRLDGDGLPVLSLYVRYDAEGRFFDLYQDEMVERGAIRDRTLRKLRFPLPPHPGE